MELNFFNVELKISVLLCLFLLRLPLGLRILLILSSPGKCGVLPCRFNDPFDPLFCNDFAEVHVLKGFYFGFLYL